MEPGQEINLLDDSLFQPQSPLLTKKTKLIIAGIVSVFVIIVIGVAAWLHFSTQPSVVRDADSAISNSSTVDQAKPPSPTPSKISNNPSCTLGYRTFNRADMDVQFCYPHAWGEAEVTDLKLTPADSGHRQSVSFSQNDYIRVSMASDDWTSSVQQRLTCHDPDNTYTLSAQPNSDWHDHYREDGEIKYAQRHLEVDALKADLLEKAGNVLDAEVCIKGYKEIDGKIYRMVNISLRQKFNPELNISNPAQHINNPEALVSLEQRSQLKLLLNSLNKAKIK